jgi:hypothetical protein
MNLSDSTFEIISEAEHRLAYDGKNSAAWTAIASGLAVQHPDMFSQLLSLHIVQWRPESGLEYSRMGALMLSANDANNGAVRVNYTTSHQEQLGLVCSEISAVLDSSVDPNGNFYLRNDTTGSAIRCFFTEPIG